MRIGCLFMFLLVSVVAFAQKDGVGTQNAIPQVVDSLYREDQFYISLAFNLINNEPAGFSQNGFSGGIHLGFIRDMPFNKRRNKALGIGIGFSRSSYNTNLFIGETVNDQTSFSILENIGSIDRNRLITNQVDIPIQYRWRTSTATAHTFWRVYTGVKASYVFAHVAKFQDSDVTFNNRNITELERFRIAGTLTIGNGSFNGFVQYDLNPLFNKNAAINGEAVNLQPIKFGVEFYVL